MQNEIRQWIRLFETSGEPLPGDVGEAFQQLGDQQRGDPEIAMVRAQQIIGGGVLSLAIEHVGDITHRMSHMAKRRHVMGFEKVVKTLKWLSDKYGFEREFRDNIISNARYRGVNPKQLTEQIRQALKIYAEAHAKLPVYNKAQWLARQAAVFLGLEKFNESRQCLHMLLMMCPTEQEFATKALEYHRNPDGTLAQYRPGILTEAVKNSRTFHVHWRLSKSKADGYYVIDAPNERVARAEAKRLLNARFMYGEKWTITYVTDPVEDAAQAKWQADWRADLAWFSGSKIIDESGNPLYLYHGTATHFDQIKPSDSGAFGPGIYLTPKPELAQQWGARKGEKNHVLTFIVKIVNPYYWSEDDKHQHADLVSKRVRAQGHDGIVCKWMNGDIEVVAFHHEQLRAVAH